MAGVILALFMASTGCATVRVVTPAGQFSQPKWPGRTVDVLNGTSAVLQVVAGGQVACQDLPPQGLCPVTFYNYSGRSFRSEIAVTGTRDGELAGTASHSVQVSTQRHDREVWEVSRLRPIR